MSLSLFFIVLLVALLVQGTMWQMVTFVDENIWQTRVTQLVYDFRSGEHNFNQEHYSEHPGMPALMLATVAHSVGLSSVRSLKVSVTLLNALSVAGVVVLARMLRPKSLWWLGAGGLVLFNSLYLSASPTDAIIAPLAVFIFLLALWHHEKGGYVSLQALLVFGLALGLALATRLHISLLIIIPLLLLLSPYVGIWRMVVIGGSALVWAQALNPLMWYEPINFLRAALIEQLGFFSGSSLSQLSPYQVSVSDFITFAPLAFISLIVALLLLFMYRWPSAVASPFILIMLVCTIVPVLTLLLSKLQSPRYFFPLVFVWEVFLPLWLLHLVQYVRASFAGIMRGSVIGLLVGGQAFLFLYTYSL